MYRIVVRFADYYFDIRYGTDTRSWLELNGLTIESDNLKRAGLGRYEPTRVLYLRKLFHNIKSMIPTHGAFVDLGCGKGRVLLIASEFGFAKVRGVEFAHELCEIALKNCAVYRDKTELGTEFRIIESDAAGYAINNDENVFFMYNPFDDVVMNKVLDNIAASLEMQPRRIWIIYNYPVHGNTIEEHGSFVKKRDFVLGHHCAVYTNSD